MSKKYEKRKTLPKMSFQLSLPETVNIDLHMCKLESNPEISIGIMPVFTPFKRSPSFPNEMQCVPDWFGIAIAVNAETRSVIVRPYDTVRNRKILNELNVDSLCLTEIYSDKTEFTRIAMDDDCIVIGSDAKDNLLGFMLNLPDNYNLPFVIEHQSEEDLLDTSRMARMMNNVVHHMHKEGWTKVSMEIYKEE